MLARCLLSGNNTEEVRIFYSYSRGDSGFRKLIDSVLSSFKWDVEVRTWYDGEIPAGSEWEKEIFRNIDAADIILLFVTHHFISSPYCRDVEVPRALLRHERGEATVIPVLVEDISAGNLPPPLRTLQFLPRNGQPVEAWTDRDDAIRHVVQGIVDIIASAKLDPIGRCRWQIRLRSTKELLSDQLQLKIVKELRAHAQDPSLRPLALGEGSVIILVESSRAGLTRFKDWYAHQEQPRIADLDLLEVFELFGAGVQASASEAPEAQPDIQDETNLLLFPSESFVPHLVKGVEIMDGDPLNPHFIFDSGDLRLEIEDEAFSAESSRLIEYFLTAVAIPADEQWVNLSPDDTNRMLGKNLAGTRMGRTLLEVDLKLKRLAASLMHPDCETGSQFWKEVFARSRSHGDFERREFATFQRVWVVPQEAVVYQPNNEQAGKISAFIVRRQIEVLCEDDYVSTYAKNGMSIAPNANDICTPVFKKIILPVIEKELNEGRNFADFCQIYCCMILATWLKKHLGDHPAWGRFIDTGRPFQLIHSIDRCVPVNLKRLVHFPDENGSRSDYEETVMTNGDETGAGRETTSALEERGAEIMARAKRLGETGRHRDSLRLLEKLEESLLESHGLSSHQTQIAMSQMGHTLHAMGRLEEAKQKLTEVLRVQRYVLGDNHPYTISSMDILANILEEMGETTAVQDLRSEIQDRKARTSETFSIRENREFYEEYMRIFRIGVFRLSRNEYDHDRATSMRVCRSYFAGAIDFRSIPLDTWKSLRDVLCAPRPQDL